MEQMKQWFYCNVVGELMEYGCKTDRTKNSIKFIQPVLLQRFEYEIRFVGSKVKIPTEAGSVLVQNEQESLSVGEQTKCQNGVLKLLLIYNVVHESLRFISGGTSQAHIKAMK
jgi:hypothetical protein